MSETRNALGHLRRVDDPPERDTTSAPAGVLDAHVHVFPPALFAAVRRWIGEHAWEIRYPFDAEAVDAFLTARGVEQYLGLHYAHAPGVAEPLNRFVLDFARTHPRCIPCATVLPGEPDAEGILDRALSAGARAVKLHAHVQQTAPDDPRLVAVFRQVVAHDALLVFHSGSAPAFPAYASDVRQLCTLEAFDHALRPFPEMKICVPHLGASETDGYVALLDRFPNLYLDTAMGLAGYFPMPTGPEALLAQHWQRILYGTDFPNIPYAWDRDLRFIEGAGLDAERRAAILGGNARRLLRC